MAASEASPAPAPPLPSALENLERPLSRNVMFLAWALILAVYAGLRVKLVQLPLDRDEGTFLLIAQSVLRGNAPYIELCDFKPPGVFYVLALGLLIAPPTPVGVHLFLQAWNLMALFGLAKLAGLWYGPRAGLWTGFVYALLSAAPVVQGQTAGTEMFLLAPLALSLWLTARGVRSSGRSRRASLILAGICGAAACWIKQPAVLPLLLAPLAIVVHHGRLVARTRNDLGWWLAGGLGLSALVLGYFAWQVGLRTFYFWSFATKLNYYGGKTEWYYFFSKFKEGVPDHALPVLLGLAGTALLIYWRHPRAWALPVFVVLSVPATWQGPYFYYHYFALLTPALALLGGAGLSALQAVRFVDRGAAGRTAFACAAGGLLLVCALAAPMRQEDRISPWTHGGHEAAAEWLKAHAEPGAYALPLFTRSQILAMAELRLPHRYPAFYTIHNDFERSAQYQLEMIADIKRHAPRFLLYAPNLDGEFRAPGDQSTAFADYADHLRAEVFAPAAYVVRARGESSRRREAYEALTPEAYEEDPEAYEVVYAILERRKDREP